MHPLVAPAENPPLPRPWYRPSLARQIIIALVLGGLIGWLRPAWGDSLYFLRDIFLNMIKSIIAPLVFSTLVVGVVGAGDLKSIGRMGIKTLVYFEIVTILALFIGLGVVNLTVPGKGIVLAAPVTQTVGEIGQTQPKTLVQTLEHVFPSSIVDAMVRGDVLQIVTFALVFAIAILSIGEKAKPMYHAMEVLSQVMFRFTSYVMMFAPIGVGAGMAHTVGSQGLGVLVNLGKLIGSLYLALILFVVLVLGTVMLIARLPILQFIRAVREPATIAFATTSSESALPKAIQVMERFGVPPQIVGFVMPTGYSFNLDGTTLYLAMASVFVAQAVEGTRNFHMTFGQQVSMMLTLIVTSKGVAAVPRASLVVLLATLNSILPDGLGAVGVAVIFGVDELMDMGRTSVNVIGNCLATAVVARWEGVFDDAKARAFNPLENPVVANPKEVAA